MRPEVAAFQSVNAYEQALTYVLARMIAALRAEFPAEGALDSSAWAAAPIGGGSYDVSDWDMAPKPPRRSEHPDEAVALLSGLELACHRAVPGHDAGVGRQAAEHREHRRDLAAVVVAVRDDVRQENAEGGCGTDRPVVSL